MAPARRAPSISTGSSESRRPAVSTRRSGKPRTWQATSMRSRVVPGVGATMARSSRTRALSRLDLPTLGSPKMTASAPSWRRRPSGAVRRSSPSRARISSTRAAKSAPTRGSMPSSAKSRLASRWLSRSMSSRRMGSSARPSAPSFMARALARGALGWRVEQIEQALGLGERELVVEERALSELARPAAARAPRARQARRMASTMRGLPWQEISTVSSPVKEWGACQKVRTTSSRAFSWSRRVR